MAALNIKNEQIERLKLALMDRYVILMMFILGIFTVIYSFIIQDKMISSYLICGIILLGSWYLFARRKCSQNRIVHTYLIFAPIYSLYVMIVFWDNSVSGFCWLLPIPLGAYIFFSKKTVFYYTLYTLIIIIIASLVANNFSAFNLGFIFPKHSQKEVMFTDTLLFVSNILIIALLLYYKDKIRKQEFLQSLANIRNDYKKVTEKESKTQPDVADVENFEKIFERIETAMKQDLLFKDIKLNLSRLSVAIDVNSTYISKTIRYKGYANFNAYLNTYRVDYVKKLFTETDFQKATLMYVYTEAGFSNQSTFNRVFKQIEGVTPSEYIQQNLATDHEQNG
ncbi:AraC family transcriptional regulator [Chryseobacterium gallinarum]|uniref:helix-turn-helix domain-containing protein n=1 Tax=Chryseobacterium gallinarum TaxID=1324352 RepID=UPI0020244B3D|nr:AraC family transcriptional regulator [Chryseobacterium gallinarum]MCL8536493.1 AraC family transcriptional regulator [Chryseobacterium gallinarum]